MLECCFFQAAFSLMDTPITPQALAIVGPTASGKTHLALQLAEKYPCEIISLDSALVYQDMNIGTAKPNAEELAAVPHHLIDIISPLQAYSAADFVNDCTRLINEIHSRNRIPLIVGGTMMYYHALTQGLNTLPQADEATRQALQQEKMQYGLAALYQRLQQIDPQTAARLEANDSQRIERALEVWHLTGKTLSEHFAEQNTATSNLSLHTLALIPQERAALHTQIAQRFHAMLNNGFLDEMHTLRCQYPQLQADMPSMRCVGYRQAWQHLEGLSNYADFVEQSIAATRQLAKRQLTWLRKLSADTILDPYADTSIASRTQNLFEQLFAVNRF